MSEFSDRVAGLRSRLRIERIMNTAQYLSCEQGMQTDPDLAYVRDQFNNKSAMLCGYLDPELCGEGKLVLPEQSLRDTFDSVCMLQELVGDKLEKLRTKEKLMQLFPEAGKREIVEKQLDDMANFIRIIETEKKELKAILLPDEAEPSTAADLVNHDGSSLTKK